ncbi:LOW QUALITY PROTEIN: pleckstrin homology domain-containing family G member 4B-like, partial [Rhinoraja longicauda]
SPPVPGRPPVSGPAPVPGRPRIARQQAPLPAQPAGAGPSPPRGPRDGGAGGLAPSTRPSPPGPPQSTRGCCLLSGWQPHPPAPSVGAPAPPAPPGSAPGRSAAAPSPPRPSAISTPDVRAPCPHPPFPPPAPAPDWRPPLKKAQSFELGPGGAAGPGVLIRGLEVSSSQLVDRTCSPREHVMLGRRAEGAGTGTLGRLARHTATPPRAGSRPRRALAQALAAERHYVSSLELVTGSYLPDLDRPDVPAELRGKRGPLFSNLEKLLDFHREHLLPALEASAACPLRLGERFLAHREQFSLYAMYVKNKPQSDALLTAHGNIFFKRRQLLLRDRSDLAAHLLEPVQRMISYGLLLRELAAECTDDQGRHRLQLHAAANMVDFQLRHGNDLLAMDSIRGCDVNLKEQGQLLRRDHFTLCCGRRRSLRNVFLFEELVVLTKLKRTEGGSESYVYKSSLKTADLGLTENIGDTGLRFELWFRRRRTNEAYILQAESADVKQAWARDIAQILWRQASRNKELRLQETVSMGMGSKVFLDLQASNHSVDQNETWKGTGLTE